MKEEDIDEKFDSKLDSRLFFKIITIMVTVIISLSGWFVAAVNKIDEKATKNTASISEVAGDIKAIKADLMWLKNAVSDGVSFNQTK